MSRKVKNKRKEKANMNAVLQIDEYRQDLTPNKSNMHKKDKQTECNNHAHYSLNVKKLVELEERSSSSDEYPLLWDEEET